MYNHPNWAQVRLEVWTYEISISVLRTYEFSCTNFFMPLHTMHSLLWVVWQPSVMKLTHLTWILSLHQRQIYIVSMSIWISAVISPHINPIKWLDWGNDDSLSWNFCLAINQYCQFALIIMTSQVWRTCQSHLTVVTWANKTIYWGWNAHHMSSLYNLPC